MKVIMENVMMGSLLEDGTTYMKVSKDECEKQRAELNVAFRKLIATRGLKMMSAFTQGPLRTPIMYGMVKTHKMPNGPITTDSVSRLKCKPIISAINGPAYRVSKLLASVVSPLLQRTRSYVRNTEGLLTTQRSRRNTLENSRVMSFNFEALYTNVENKGAVRALEKRLREYEKDIDLFGLLPVDIIGLTRLVLKNNLFRYDNQLYKQVRGLAMGSSLAPVLSILFLDDLERQHIFPNLASSLLYHRYVDDVFSTYIEDDEVRTVEHQLNNMDPEGRIRVTKDQPSDYLPFLSLRFKSDDISE